jgi:hypothetical protein
MHNEQGTESAEALSVAVDRMMDRAEAELEEEEGCPVGDPDCDAPDDGEWHCHDACEAPSDN